MPDDREQILTVIITCVALLWLLIILVVTPAAAQTQSDLSSLDLEQLTKVQFYTASKRSQEISTTPASVTVVTRDDIRTFGYRTLADVLQGVRGYWINSDRNYSYVGVRGFARPGDYNTRILLLIDGHRINDNVFYQALIGTEFPLDLDLVEKIEIVRGPASSLYGTNAFLGIVNVVTRRPSISPSIEVSADAGTDFLRKGRLTFGLPRFLDGAMFSASLYRSDGVGHLFFPEFDSPSTNNGVAERVDGDRSGSALALIHWRHWTAEGVLGSREKLIPTASFDTIFNDPGNRTIDSRGFADFTYERDFLSGLQVMSRWYYDAYAYRGTYAYSLEGTRTMDFDSARGNWVGTETNVSKPISHRDILTAGVEFRYSLNKDQENWWENSASPVLNDHRTGTMAAFYAQDEVKITSRISLNAGARIDHYNSFGSSLSPRAAAIFHLDDKTTLKYMYGHAFRVPNAYEMYYSDAVSQEPSPRLQPETVRTHNVSFERAVTPNFRVTTEAYYTRLSSLIDTRIDPATDMTQYINVNSATAKGFELEVLAQRHSWRTRLSYGLQDTNDGATSLNLANVARHTVKLQLHAPLKALFSAGSELQFQTPQYTYLGVRVPGSFNSTLTISTRKPILGMQVAASCYNLLNRRNYDPVPVGLAESRILQNGREFRVNISRTFSRQ